MFDEPYVRPLQHHYLILWSIFFFFFFFSPKCLDFELLFFYDHHCRVSTSFQCRVSISLEDFNFNQFNNQIFSWVAILAGWFNKILILTIAFCTNYENQFYCEFKALLCHSKKTHHSPNNFENAWWISTCKSDVVVLRWCLRKARVAHLLVNKQAA